jgi:hypothetical protein
MKSLLPLWHAWLRLYYKRASVEIDPMHPDVAYIARRLAELGVR